MTTSKTATTGLFSQITGCLLAAALSLTASANELPGQGIKVQFAKNFEAGEIFPTLLVMKAAERWGYEVLPWQEMSNPLIYASVANGDVQVFAGYWDPLHIDNYKSIKGDTTLVKRGLYYTAGQGYLIDKKTADAYNISNISQLRDPKIAKLFDVDGDGKADLAGCEPGWGCEGMIEHHLTAYELRDTVTHHQGSYGPLIADVITRFKAGQPVLYYTWVPLWPSSIIKPGQDAIWLEVPFSATPGSRNDDTTLPNGKNYGFASNKVHIIINKAFADKHPDLVKLAELMKLPTADITAQNALMANGQNSAADIDRHTEAWIKAHQETFDGWLHAARAAAK